MNPSALNSEKNTESDSLEAPVTASNSKESLTPNSANTKDEDSLEAPATSASPKESTASTESVINATSNATPLADDSKPKKSLNIKERFLRILHNLNIYTILFIIVFLIGIAVVGYSYLKSRNTEKPTVLNTQNLNQDTLNQLKNSDVKLGDAQQTLNVQSNAVFAGKVLLRDSLDIAGAVTMSQPLSLPGLTVSGIATLDQIQASKLSLSSDASIQGQLIVQKGLNVTGNGTFGGSLSATQITVDTLQLNKDLQITHHIDAGGSTPSKSNGSALGNGGTSSVSGTDTAGTVAINVGSSPAAGCFTTITFTAKFNDTPHVVISPSGSDAGALAYYVNKTATSFSICDATPATAGQSFSFDYIVID